MTDYFVAETDATACVTNDSRWTPVNCKSLAAAKREASRRRMYLGTAAHVATREKDGKFIPVAVKRPHNPIDMSSRETWQDL